MSSNRFYTNDEKEEKTQYQEVKNAASSNKRFSLQLLKSGETLQAALCVSGQGFLSFPEFARVARTSHKIASLAQLNFNNQAFDEMKKFVMHEDIKGLTVDKDHCFPSEDEIAKIIENQAWTITIKLDALADLIVRPLRQYLCKHFTDEFENVSPPPSIRFLLKTKTLCQFLQDNEIDKYLHDFRIKATNKLKIGNRSPEVIENLLAWGANLYCLDRLKSTLLNNSIYYGNANALRKLIELGIDPNIINDLRETALTAAARNRDPVLGPKLVEILVKSGANLNYVNKKGQSALHLAVIRNSIGIVKVLVDAGINIELTDYSGKKALHYAKEYIEITKLLLEAGANPDDNYFGIRKYGYMLFGNHPTYNLVRELEQKQYSSNFTQKYTCSKTALISAVESKEYENISLLLRESKEVNKQNQQGETPLMIAARNGDIKILGDLLAAKAHVNVFDRFGMTPLMYAAKNGHEEVVRVLLVAGANKSALNNYNENALDFARRSGSQDLVHLLSQEEDNRIVQQNNLLQM